ncbi:unnamed protein product [Linum trigynum]|uniref:Uncharacterized protein n=1 Tax=Linum trigynum TaxID=586398 RepID=A0AAV2CV04_9ROSI
MAKSSSVMSEKKARDRTLSRKEKKFGGGRQGGEAEEEVTGVDFKGPGAPFGGGREGGSRHRRKWSHHREKRRRRVTARRRRRGWLKCRWQRRKMAASLLDRTLGRGKPATLGRVARVVGPGQWKEDGPINLGRRPDCENKIVGLNSRIREQLGGPQYRIGLESTLA